MGISANHPLLEIDLLRTFVAISDRHSFTRAAAAVHRTPSAVSMQMKRLEELLGHSLFSREGRAVALTTDGEALLSYARRLLRLNEEAVSRFLAPPVEGKVRFGAPDDFGTRFLPQILSRFASTHRQVEVDVILAPSRTLIRRQDRGELDLALITAGQAEGDAATSDPIYTEPLVWVGLKGGIACEMEPVPLALSNPGCAWRNAATKALDSSARRYRIAYNSEHSQGQIAALLADLAIAPLPASLAVPPLVMLGPQDGLPPLANYQILLRRHPDLGAAASALADDVVEGFAAEALARSGAAGALPAQSTANA